MLILASCQSSIVTQNMVWLTVKPFTNIIFSQLVHIFSCSDSAEVCTKTATPSDFSSCWCIATDPLAVCQWVLLYCELYSKYPVLYSIGDFEDTHTHTDSGQVSGGGFKSLAHTETEWVWRRGKRQWWCNLRKAEGRGKQRGRHCNIWSNTAVNRRNTVQLTVYFTFFERYCLLLQFS